MLLCTVRNCRQPLARLERTVICPNKHSFDIARNGYINLLQSQDRRSKVPGDTAEAVAARRRLHDRGVTRPLFEAIAGILGASKTDTVLDAGCGEGFYLGTLSRQTGCAAYGVDISTRAVDAAARRYPECEWIVANADRFVPYTDSFFSVISSITSRMNSAEFRRILKPEGRLLIGIPAPDDLIELRGVGRERVDRTVETFAKDFEFTGQTRATTAADLDASAVEDVLVSIYRPMRSEPIEAQRVTFSLDLLLFKPRA